MRKRLMKMWREAKVQHSDPVEAWASIIEDADKAKSFKQAPRSRRFCTFLPGREVNELIAASNVYTVKTYGPDRVAGFADPAMSMVSYASGARYLSLIGGTCLSFYDWYCDLPPGSLPMTWGEQTDVPESADWYNSSHIIAWAPTCRRPAPRMHFFTEVRYKGTKTVAITPDYAEIAKLCGSVAGAEAGYRCRDGAGDGPCDAA